MLYSATFSALSVSYADSSPGGRAKAGSSFYCLRQRLGIGAPNAAANGMSDYIAGEELQLVNERLMQCNFYADFTIFSENNKRNYKRLSLTKVFAELFSKSDRVPRRHTNNSKLTKSRKFFMSHTIIERCFFVELALFDFS